MFSYKANGSSYENGRVLVVVQSSTGKLLRISTRSKTVREIDLGGRRLVNGDGLVAHGSRLYVVDSQFDKRGGTPVLPFTVASVRRP